MHLAVTLFLPLVVAVRPSAQQDVDFQHPKSWPKTLLIDGKHFLRSSICPSCKLCHDELWTHGSKIRMEQHEIEDFYKACSTHLGGEYDAERFVQKLRLLLYQLSEPRVNAAALRFCTSLMIDVASAASATQMAQIWRGFVKCDQRWLIVYWDQEAWSRRARKCWQAP